MPVWGWKRVVLTGSGREASQIPPGRTSFTSASKHAIARSASQHGNVLTLKQAMQTASVVSAVYTVYGNRSGLSLHHRMAGLA